MRRYFRYDFPLCDLYILDDNGAVAGVYFDEDARMLSGSLRGETALTKEAARQLGEYFAGKRTAFDLPLAPRGTEFQMEDWKALQDIPYGETRSYSDIARAIGRPKAVRAVGMANNRNPISIIIPCHRVIGADGSLVGYGGGLELKKALLELERAQRRVV
jgi:methylated-DNA-[protein]-cysteine S-methyltransferase